VGGGVQAAWLTLIKHMSRNIRIAIKVMPFICINEREILFC
jgi:hypothetical protein